MIKKTAPATETAAANKLQTTVELKGAKRPKLMKTTASQRTKTTSKGMETEVVACSYINQRVLPRSSAILNAWPWSQRCVSFLGESAWILSKTTWPPADGGANREALVASLDHT